MAKPKPQSKPKPKPKPNPNPNPTQVATLHAAPLLVDGPLFYPVKPAECSWALEDAKGGGGRWLTLSLEKAHQNMRWLDLTRKPGVSYHKSGAAHTEQG